jgi:hypothetical protein
LKAQLIQDYYLVQIKKDQLWFAEKAVHFSNSSNSCKTGVADSNNKHLSAAT